MYSNASGPNWVRAGWCFGGMLFVFLCILTAAAYAEQPDGKLAKPEKGELVRAVLRGDKDLVRELLRRGANVNESLGDEEGPINPLFVAIERGHEEIAIILITHSRGLDLTRAYRGWNALDFANYFGQRAVADRIASEMAIDQREELGQLDVDRATWVANALAAISENRDHGLGLGLSYIVVAYQTPNAGMIDGAAILRQANCLRDEYRKQATNAKIGSSHLGRLITFVSQTLEDKKLAQRINQHIVGTNSLLVDAHATVMPYGIMRSVMYDHLYAQRFYESVLHSAYLLGKNDPQGACKVIDEFSKPSLNTNLTDKANDIIKRNPRHFHPAVNSFVQSETPAEREKSFQDAWNLLFQEIRSANAACTELLRRIDEVEYREKKAKELERSFAALNSSLYILTTVTSFENQRLAKQIYAIGSGAIQIGQSIATCVAAGALTAASCCTLVGGIVAGTMAIISAFDNRPSSDELIFKQIVELRQQVEDLRKQMHERFDDMDRRLDQMFKLVIHGFQSLNIDLAFAREELRIVAVQLTLMESNLLDLEPNVRNYIEVGVDRELWKKVGRCLDWQKHEKSRLPYSEFSSALDFLRQAATREAKDALSVGRFLSKEELDDDSKLAARFIALSKDGLDCNIGLMQSIARRFNHDGVFSQARLANPVRWAMMVEAYAQLALQYPDYYYKQTTVTGVEEMSQIGSAWQEAVRSLKAVKTDATSKSNTTLYGRLLDNYKAKAEQLRAVVAERIQKYQIENVEGYDLWAGSDQEPQQGKKRPVFGMSKVAVVVNFMRLTLDAPSQLVNLRGAKPLFGNALLMAHHLGLGEIQISAGGYPSKISAGRGINPPWDVDGLSVSITAAFHYKDGDRTRILDVLSGKKKIDIKRGEMQRVEAYKWAIDEIPRQWSAMQEHVLAGKDSKAIPAETGRVVKELLEGYFKPHREALERELWAGIKGTDGRLVDAMRQLTAAKAMLDAFVSMGMAKSVTEQTELRGLLASEKLIKGQTRLLDESVLEAIANKGVTLLEVIRDVEWLDAPAKKLEVCFKDMTELSEPQPLIEATMERLALLKNMHESAQPKHTLPNATKELKKAVQALGQP